MFDVFCRLNLLVLPSVRSRTRENVVSLAFAVDRPLVDQVAVVTGASGGIGAAVALHLARAGARVALVARREDKLLETKTSIEDEGGVAITVKADVTNRQEVRETFVSDVGVPNLTSILDPPDALVLHPRIHTRPNRGSPAFLPGSGNFGIPTAKRSTKVAHNMCTNMLQVEEMVKHTQYALGPIDILVNNAGTMYYTMMKNLHVEQWEKQIDLNIKVRLVKFPMQRPCQLSFFDFQLFVHRSNLSSLVTRVFQGMMNSIGCVLGGMVERKSGHIINMSSDAGRKVSLKAFCSQNINLTVFSVTRPIFYDSAPRLFLLNCMDFFQIFLDGFLQKHVAANVSVCHRHCVCCDPITLPSNRSISVCVVHDKVNLQVDFGNFTVENGCFSHPYVDVRVSHEPRNTWNIKERGTKDHLEIFGLFWIDPNPVLAQTPGCLP